MKFQYKLASLIWGIFLLSFGQLCGQDKVKGPVIVDYGDTFSIPSPDLIWSVEEDLNLIFDITAMNENTALVSAQINTLARCINMHANTGLSKEKMNIVAVFHSTGTYSVINDKSYRTRYGSSNPNSGLLKILSDLGVELYVCGQSLYSRDVDPEHLHPSIKIALSAMTVLAKYQSKGYSVIKF